MAPTRRDAIIGDPREPFDEPSYPTDPRDYGLLLFKWPLSDKESDRDYRTKVNEQRGGGQAADQERTNSA